jgi:RNA polymerase sigma-70 factor (ECF subfamily)
MTSTTPACLLGAWSAHEAELRGYLHHRLGDRQDAEDLLQDVFLKALRQGRHFCSVANTRAWLFQVARNALTDRLRVSRDHSPLPDDLPAPPQDPCAPVEDLSQCLPRVLAELSEADRLALTLCDLEGQPQQVLAERLGISLPGAKSRLQRARTRLQRRLVEACQVRFDDAGKVCCFTPRPGKP